MRNCRRCWWPVLHCQCDRGNDFPISPGSVYDPDPGRVNGRAKRLNGRFRKGFHLEETWSDPEVKGQPLRFEAGDKFFDGAIVRPFRGRREKASGNLPVLAMIDHALTAFSPARARVIGTGTIF